MKNINKAFVFDFDDTLAITDCKIIVNGVLKLTPAEYNTYEVKENDVFDYSEFGKVINPKNLECMDLAKKVCDENHAVFVLTARGINAKNPINEYLKENEISVHEVFCVGGKTTKEDIAKQKRKVLLTIIENYDKTYFYDDCEENIETVKDLKIKAYLIK